jgi:DeoR/GlpR family transcriptional regulator of sugar metabolism
MKRKENMLYVDSRRQQLAEYISEQKTLSVNQILSHFDASPATIRKDLAFLESSGLIRRSRGEAHFINSGSLPPNDLRQALYQEEKQRIAGRAVEMINDGDTIILDSGTTTFQIAQTIKKLNDFRRLTIITHSIKIGFALSECSNHITVVLSGGVLSSSTLSLIGPDVEHFFSNLEVDTAFISASGVKRDGSLASYLPFEPPIKKAIISAAKHVVAVIDSSKFNNTCVTKFAELKNVDTLITDTGFKSVGMDEIMKENNVEVIMV